MLSTTPSDTDVFGGFIIGLLGTTNHENTESVSVLQTPVSLDHSLKSARLALPHSFVLLRSTVPF
jgi:hypothetical protein